MRATANAMRAAYHPRYGPEHLEVRDVDRPEVTEDRVLVRVRAASLHPDVWHVVHGRPWVLRAMGGGLLRPTHPIPGTDMAGVVEAVGPEVAVFRPGDAVFGETTAIPWSHGGALAEHVAVPEGFLAPKPENVSFEQAAAVPTSGFIALQNLRSVGQLEPGHKVLVIGGGGGVGSLALQITKSRGAHVTAVDSTSKLDLLRALGADEVVDFTKEDFRRRGVRYDLIVDIPGHRPLRSFKPALAPDGRYIPIGHEGYGALGKRVFGLIPHFFKLMFLARFSKHLGGAKVPPLTRPEVMATLADLLRSGTITPPIDSTHPLEQVCEALRHMVEDELHGKVIVVPGGP